MTDRPKEQLCLIPTYDLAIVYDVIYLAKHTVYVNVSSDIMIN